MNDDVKFYEDNSYKFKHQSAGNKGGMTEKLINKGLAKNKKQAEVILLILAIIIIAISIFVWKSADQTPDAEFRPVPVGQDPTLQ